MTNPAMPQTIAMTPRMVAERWLCSEKNVRRLIESGELPHFKAGGKLIRLLRSEVEAYEHQSAASQKYRSDFGIKTESESASDLEQPIQKKQRAKPRLSTQQRRALLARS